MHCGMMYDYGYYFVQIMDISLTPALTLLDSVVRFGEYDQEDMTTVQVQYRYR